MAKSFDWEVVLVTAEGREHVVWTAYNRKRAREEAKLMKAQIAESPMGRKVRVRKVA